MNKDKVYLGHNLVNTVIKTDGQGKSVTAGELGLSRRDTVEHLRVAGVSSGRKRLKVKRVTPAPERGKGKKAKLGRGRRANGSQHAR